jgi:hypothetical protein
MSKRSARAAGGDDGPDGSNERAGPGPGSAATATTLGMVQLHRSRMFDWRPAAVIAIAPCPGTPLVAVGYESGALELWDMLQLVCTQVGLHACTLGWEPARTRAAAPPLTLRPKGRVLAGRQGAPLQGLCL